MPLLRGHVEAIDPALPQDLYQSTVGTPDIYAASCGGTGAGDRVYELTAPVDGPYAFEIIQSNYDAVLAVLDADTCEELACAGGASGARTSVDRAAGQSV